MGTYTDIRIMMQCQVNVVVTSYLLYQFVFNSIERCSSTGATSFIKVSIRIQFN